MSSRIFAALDVTDLSSKYKAKFKYEQITDAQVSLCIKNPTYTMLAKVMESPEDYDIFVHAFVNPEKFQNQDKEYGHLDENANSLILKQIASCTTNPFANPLIVTDTTDSDDAAEDLSHDSNSTKQHWASSKFTTFASTPNLNVIPNPNTKAKLSTSQSGSSKSLTAQFLSSIKLPSFSNPKSDLGTTIHKTASYSQLQNAVTLNSTRDAEKIFNPIPNHFTSQPVKPPAISQTLKVQPVQIIDIPVREPSEDNSNKGGLIFHHEELKGILSKIGRRPVALLSIAGPSRQGKSFILGYMLRYLQSLPKPGSIDHNDYDDGDWMGKSEYKKHQPLLGGFLWRSGVERETTGIWMWPEPFAIQAEDGTEFDVLLVDTQGVFDDYTDKKDWATIVGLSLLTSSCLIFNISHSLQEDSLITLKDFMDFGLMAKDPTSPIGDSNSFSTDRWESFSASDSKKFFSGSSTFSSFSSGSFDGLPPDDGNNDEKPFQKLLFLIRDWNAPDDYPYGAVGGADYLRWNLERKNNRMGARLRSQIKQCFQQLDCFLMPEPGPFVRRKTYDGSVAGMGEEFADNIERFIEHLFDPSTFPSKIISGNLVTGDDLLIYFEQFVKIFNSDQMPSKDDMNQATAFICNQTILNKCLSTYEQSMEQIQEEYKRERDFLLEHELLACHESAQHQTLELFHYSRKMGTQEEIGKFKTELTTRLNEALKLGSIMNGKKMTDAVQGATLKLETYFISLMEEKISRASCGPDEFVMEETFQIIFNESEISCKYFLEQLLSIDELSRVPSAQQNFQSIIYSLKEPMKLHNRMRKSDSENQMRDETTRLSITFKSSMHLIIQKFRYWTGEQLQCERDSTLAVVVSKFNTLYGESSLYPTGAQLLQQSIEKELSDIIKLVQMQNDNYLLSCNHLVSELANNYSQKMEECALMEAEELGATHNQQKHNCLNSLKDSEDFYRLLPDQAEDFITELSVKIQKSCQQLVNKWLPRIRQRLIKSYKERISAFYGDEDRLFEPWELKELHDKIKAGVSQEFKLIINQIPVPLHSENIDGSETSGTAKIFEDFEAEIDNFMETIYDKNKLKSEAVHATVEGILSKSKSTYLELSRYINEACHLPSKFQQLSQEAQEQIGQYFQEECQSSLPETALQSQIEPSLIQLQEYMESVPAFKRVAPSTIEISGPQLKFSRELVTLENIINNSHNQIKEFRWISTEEIIIDENLCGEFWSGKNIGISSNKITIVGNNRLIVVSGENGKSEDAVQPPQPKEPGSHGLNGLDGEAGESGGNIVILAHEIVNSKNLRLISNGGMGGNGQPGGSGTNGQDGVDGDQRYPMSLAELEFKFPSPAKFVDLQVHENLRKGHHSMRELVGESGSGDVTHLESINSGSRCWTLETKEGAKFRYGFYQGNFRGLISGRSFYVWFQGAPGTLGQFGGNGGHGGRGGQPGNAGYIEIPAEYESDISISREAGTPGITGRKGVDGKNGADGVQGLDFAVVDPYAGLFVPSNFIAKRRFSGRLEMYVAEDWKRGEAAYCPHERKYISFMETIALREGIEVYKQPVNNQQQKPLINARRKNPIQKETLQQLKSFPV